MFIRFYSLHFLINSEQLLRHFNSSKQKNSRARKKHSNHLKIHAFTKIYSSSHRTALLPPTILSQIISNLFFIVVTRENVRSDLGVFDHKVDLSFLSWLVDTNLHISNKTCCRRTNLFFCGEKKMSQSELNLKVCTCFFSICIVIDSAGRAIKYFGIP